MPALPPPYQVDFQFHRAALPTGIFVGIESPKYLDRVSSLVVEIAGWVAQTKSCEFPPPTQVAIFVNGEEWLSTSIDLPRPDVAPAVRSEAGEEITTDLNGFSFLLPVHLSMAPGAKYKLVIFHGELRSPAYSVAELSFAQIGPVSGNWHLKDPIQPVLVNSVGRSGSSLLCRMLAANPDCHVSRSINQFGELQILDYVARAMSVLSSQGNSAELNRPEIRPDFYSLPTPFFCSPALRRSEPLPDELEGDLTEELTRQARLLAQGILSEHIGQVRARNENVKFLVEKTWNSFNANHIRLLFRSTKEIFLVRDPRSFWSSQIAFLKKNQTSDAAIRVHLDSTADRLQRLARVWRDRYLESYLVRYEDLILKPRDTLSGLFSYLGRPVDATFLDAASNMIGDASEHARMLRTAGNAEVNDSDFETYLSTLREDAREAIVRDARDWGYELS